MLTRATRVVGVLACAAIALSAAPSHAVGSTASCTTPGTGIGVDPSANHYYVVGVASADPTRTVVSMTFKCTIRNAATGVTQPSTQLAYVVAGGAAVAAYDISTTSFGPFQLCTQLAITYTDTTRTDFTQCRALTGV